MAPDGSDEQFELDGAGYCIDEPDWQPLPVDTASTHVRPAGATPFRVPLVPAAKHCTAPNRTHGPPLAFPSCNPPQPGIAEPHSRSRRRQPGLRQVRAVRCGWT